MNQKEEETASERFKKLKEKAKDDFLKKEKRKKREENEAYVSDGVYETSSDKKDKKGKKFKSLKEKYDSYSEGNILY